MAGHLAPCGAYYSDRSTGACQACYGRAGCACIGCAGGVHKKFDNTQQRAAKGNRNNSDLFPRTAVTA